MKQSGFPFSVPESTLRERWEEEEEEEEWRGRGGGRGKWRKRKERKSGFESLFSGTTYKP